MTQSQKDEASDISVVSHAEQRQGLRKPRFISIALQLFSMLGLAVLLYPQAANWTATRGHDAEVSGYIREIEQMPDPERVEAIARARDYNADIPGGVLRDPYALQLGDDEFTSDLRYESYLEQLSVGERESIGQLSYPRLGISLPVYHGTDDATISKGIGHLYGSSLPVGGSSSHAVMTSHSGLVGAELFSKLPDAQVGDVFTITVMGEKNYYEVRNLETVLPYETGSLQVIEGGDWVTLLTCTPINVNSHRFLVQAEHIATPPPEEERVIPGDGIKAGFPWWAAVFVGGSGLAAYLIFKPRDEKQAAQGRHRIRESQLARIGRKQKKDAV